jgi:hypothetical protein
MKTVLMTLLILISLNIGATTSLMVGTIQFPHSIKTIPMVRVYSCGKKIPFQLCEADNEAKQFMFRVPQLIKQTRFCVLVTQEVHFAAHASKDQTRKNNTIDYLKVIPGQPYKFYELALTNTLDEHDKTIPTWAIKNRALDPHTGKIPDEAIIICYDPNCIATLSGGSAFEFPTITLKPDLIALLGSEVELQNLSNKLLLSAIDSDTVHATITPKYQQKISPKSAMTLVAPVS